MSPARAQTRTARFGVERTNRTSTQDKPLILLGSNHVLLTLKLRIPFFQTLDHVGGSDRLWEKCVLEDSTGVHDTDEERWRFKLQHCEGKSKKLLNAE